MKRVRLLLCAAVTSIVGAQSAGAFSGCDAVLPDPVWPIKTQLLQLESKLHGIKYGSYGYISDERKACVYYQRGLLFHFDGKFDKAIDAHTHAIAVMATFADAYAARADAYADAGQRDKATADYDKAGELASADGPDDLSTRCWVRTVRGKPLDLALADCNAAVRREPDKAEFLQARGFVQFRMGNDAAAIADCSAALERKPTLAYAHYVRGLAKLHSGDAAGGNADLERAKERSWRIAEIFAAWGIKP